MPHSPSTLEAELNPIEGGQSALDAQREGSGWIIQKRSQTALRKR